MTQDELITYCQNEYNALADHPFKYYPDCVALRHQNRKWFALIMPVSGDKLGLDDPSNLTIVNLKVDPELGAVLREQPGFFPAYHMSKEHWLSVRLDAFARPEDIGDLIAASFAATA